MTIHLVCLDGTGQQMPQAHLTNVALIFKSLGGTVIDGGNGSWEATISQAGATAEMGKYLPGVGTEGNPILQALGQGFGDGIAEQIVRGYTFLSRSYAAGDKILINGFSRGAAAARALAGFVAVQGLLTPANYDASNKDEAYLRAIAAWYLYRKSRPDLANQASLTDIQVQTGETIPTLTPADFIAVPAIDSVAVFDTVSSLGVPQPRIGGGVSYDFSIADTYLNPKVLNGFHALSADETRAVFAPTYWTPRQGVTQVIFPGCHSNIGGGFANTGLSDRACVWMLVHLANQGLICDMANLPRSLAPNPLDFAEDDSTAGMWVLLPKSPRVFPASATAGQPDFAIDDSIHQRWGQTVTVLQQGSPGPYKSTGLMGANPLYTPSSAV
jgi:uncharacterized protein (DUF2235 family)